MVKDYEVTIRVEGFMHPEIGTVTVEAESAQEAKGVVREKLSLSAKAS